MHSIEEYEYVSATQDDVRTSSSAIADSFPDHLAKTGREEMIAALEAAGAKADRARRRKSRTTARWKPTTKPSAAPNCSRSTPTEIDGVIVTLPNFGDERAIADTLRLSGLKVPVLVQATPDDATNMTIAAPPRQLLRQNVGLQQPEAVRHSVFADHAAHRSRSSDGVRDRSRMVLQPSAAW